VQFHIISQVITLQEHQLFEQFVLQMRPRGHCHRGWGQFFWPRGRGRSEDLSSLVKCSEMNQQSMKHIEMWW